MIIKRKNNLLKKYLFIIIFIMMFSFIGCTYQNKPFVVKEGDNLTKLNSVVYPETEKVSKDINKEYLDKINSFTLKTSKELFNKEDNYIYSPVSLYIALGMLTEGVQGSGYDELKSLLKFNELEDLRSNVKAIFETNYYNNSKGKANLANSIWIKKGFNVENDYLNTLTNNYYTEVYDTTFDDLSKEEICGWINHYTENLINMKKENLSISPETVLMLINTIYFDNKWLNSFDPNKSFENTFYTSTEEVKANYMNHEVMSSYYDGEKYVRCDDMFENGNTISYYLPKGDTKLYELFDMDLFNDNELKIGEVSITVPKFEYKSHFDLIGPLKNMGVDKIFTSADFSKITKEDIFVSGITQDAGIKFSEEGVKAAAVTVISMDEEAAQMGLYLKLNKPFIYIIKDSNNTPLFIGVINNPNK